MAPSSTASNADPGSAPGNRTSCHNCWVRTLCLGSHLPEALIAQADALVERPGPLRPGEYLVRPGDPCDGIHIVRSGLIKKLTVDPQGQEQVLGFYLGGDVVGFEGLDEGSHQLSLQALDTTALCYLSLADLEQIACTLPNLYRRVMHLLANGELQEVQDNIFLRDPSAEARVAGFLLRFAARLGQRRLDDRRFELKIARRDIASYLGLQRETVSRVLSRLQAEGVIDLQPGKQVRILDLLQLRTRAPASGLVPVAP